MTMNTSFQMESRKQKVGQKEVTDNESGGETDEEDSEAGNYTVDVNHNDGRVVMKLKKC